MIYVGYCFAGDSTLPLVVGNTLTAAPVSTVLLEFL